MQSVADILKLFDPMEDKYVSREYQSFGVHLAQKLNDERHKSLYIKLAKTLPRPVLEAAYRFVIDSKARNMGALFMWKLKELGVIGKPKTNGTNLKQNRPTQTEASKISKKRRIA